MYPEACHDYWGGKPLYPINKTHSNSCISNIMTHLASKWVKNSVNHLKFAWNAWECVCVYVWNGSFKVQNILSICFPFFSLFSGIGQNWAKCDIFFQIYFVSISLMYFAIVVIINKAFKLFKLVLVVYCDSCCHW